MIVKNAYYPHQLPTKIVVETLDGRFCEADLSPFRKIEETELQPLAVFVPEMGDEIPGYTMRLYGLRREDGSNPVKAARQRLGLTQAQLAAAASINVRQVQKIESGEIRIENVTLANAARLAAALGVAIEELLK